MYLGCVCVIGDNKNQWVAGGWADRKIDELFYWCPAAVDPTAGATAYKQRSLIYHKPLSFSSFYPSSAIFFSLTHSHILAFSISFHLIYHIHRNLYGLKWICHLPCFLNFAGTALSCSCDVPPGPAWCFALCLPGVPWPVDDHITRWHAHKLFWAPAAAGVVNEEALASSLWGAPLRFLYKHMQWYRALIQEYSTFNTTVHA